jgi:extracellular factor (EF) 3-hydroxypalmitic acid methyl ester biosynthesis protein
LEAIKMSGVEVIEEGQLTERLSQGCARLVKRLDSATRTEDLEGAFASFFGSADMDQLQALSRRSVGKGRRLKKIIRDRLAPLYRRSGIWRHCIQRPFGYPGDYSILEHVYDQSHHPETVDDVGKMIDRWSISTGLPVAVQGRKDALRLHLQELAEGMCQQGKIAQVLSIACGGAREIRELPVRVHPHLELTLLDKDPLSLRYAADKLSAFQSLRFRTVASDALLAGSGSTAILTDRKYDLIYSFGLFDYLRDHQLVQCLNNFAPLLKANGWFAFCLKDHRHYDSLFYDLLLDWRFVARIREDAVGLAEQAKLRIMDRMTVKGMAVNIYLCQLETMA